MGTSFYGNVSGSSGSGSGLPAVTASDNGDVLTVVEGTWAKSAPSGGVLKVTVTNESDVWTMDKTFAEIVAAFLAGTHIIVDITNVDENTADFGTMSGYRIDQSNHCVYVDYGSNKAEFLTGNENGYPQIDNS